ncbi:zinc transporter 10 isoform X2 [Pyrgilauda ruficollis]|uniref:zinc transporter 10 isoform X2 n=1 Tax=Pyrgilauda ruficollis TaxID=221976 RepID=UPI001B85BD8C|nr:zinc transporter 10 isoform X2 [Pyrgilauda ruficollis]
MGRYSGKTCRLIFMLVLTVGFFVAELVSGYLGNSIALVSDSFNMLSDLISLCVGLSTGRIARRSRRGPRATYGYSRAEAVGALSNAVFLTALCFTILVDSVLRLARPEPIDDAQLVLIVGTLGLAVNIVGLLVFQDWGACCRGRRPSPSSPAAAALRDVPGSIPNGEEDEAGESPNDQKSPEEGSEKKKEKKSEALNIRGVLLHVMGDALGSVVVVVTATIFYVRPLGDAPCNWQCYIDPSLTIVMVFIILSSAFPLIKETSTILLQMVPKGVDMQLLSAAYQIRKIFHEAGVHSVTIQPEYADHKTSHLLCSSPCISKACDSHLCCSQREPPRAETNGYVEKSESSLSAQHKDNGSRKSDVEIPMEDPVSEGSVKNVKNCDMSDDKSQSGSTRF